MIEHVLALHRQGRNGAQIAAALKTAGRAISRSSVYEILTDHRPALPIVDRTDRRRQLNDLVTKSNQRIEGQNPLAFELTGSAAERLAELQRKRQA